MLVYQGFKFRKKDLIFVHYDLPDDVICKVAITANCTTLY